MDDRDIIERIQTGECESFSLLVEKYHRQLLGFIYRIVGDEQIVEDIGQEVFLSVYRSIKTFDLDEGTPFSAWLFICARNRCVSELRKKRPVSMSIDEAAERPSRDRSPEQTVIGTELLHAIRTSLEQLPEPYKSAIVESVRGTSLKEIAVREGVPVGTVKSRIARARERMKTMLRDHVGGTER